MNLLLVEDNPGDVLLTQEAVARYSDDTTLNVVSDGAGALAYLRNEGEHAGKARPDLVLLDLNLPDMRGHEVLAAVKSDPELRSTPVVILSSSALAEDVHAAYDGYANTYITKPGEFRQYDTVVRLIREYWETIAELPTETW